MRSNETPKKPELLCVVTAPVPGPRMILVEDQQHRLGSARPELLGPRAAEAGSGLLEAAEDPAQPSPERHPLAKTLL